MGATQRRRWAYRSWRFAALLAGTTTSSFAGSPSHRLEEVPAEQQEKLLQGTQQEPKIPVTISYQPALYWALPIYLADQRGYFDELGLDASFRTYPSGGPQVNDAVENQAWDVGGAGSVPCILGSFQGIETVGISNDESEGNALVGNAAGTVSWPPASMVGVPVAITPDSTGHYAVEACLAQQGFDPEEDDAFVLAEQGGVMEAMAKGDAIYGSLWAPNTYHFVEENKGASVLCHGKSAGATVPGGIMVRRAFGEERPELVAKILAAWLRAIGYMLNRKNRAKSIEYMKEFYALNGVEISYSAMQQEFETRPIYDLDGQLELMDRSTYNGVSVLDEWFTNVATFMLKRGNLDAIPDASGYITSKYMEMVKADEKLNEFTRREDPSYFVKSVETPSASKVVSFKCDPCLDRAAYTVQVIAHGVKGDSFWQQVRAAAIQSAKDFRVNLIFDLYESFDDKLMAEDILAAASAENRADVLVVTIPSEVVQEAVATAISKNVPVFGMNSGYDVADNIGILGFVSMEEYVGGKAAASQFLSYGKNITRALFINHEQGNSALTDRFEGFSDTLKNEVPAIEVEELVVDFSNGNTKQVASDVEGALSSCQYDAVLLSGDRTLDFATSVLYSNGCLFSNHLLGTFDTSSQTYDAIATGRLSFAISQQQHLQGALAVAMAATYATAGKRIARSSQSSFGVYFSGPAVVDIASLPSPDRQICVADAFPVCPNTKAPSGRSESNCPCIDRKSIKIGGVLHGTTADAQWDIVFAQARQAADDMGVELILDRFDNQESDEILFTKMSAQILALCNEGVDGLFVSIPSVNLVSAIEECQRLGISVMSINSGSDISKSINLEHHIGQLEFSAGLRAGLRLVDSGMKRGYCLNNDPENAENQDRCAGLKDSIRLSPGVIYGGEINVPLDKNDQLKVVEEFVAVGGNWDGISLLLCSPSLTDAALSLQERHPNVLLSVFDPTDPVKEVIGSRILFAVDQDFYLEGYLPVWLLATYAATGEKLATSFVETGPRFVEEAPSKAQQTCEANLYAVCDEYFELNQLTKVRPAGLALCAIVLLASIFFAGWVLSHRRTSVVRKSQPFFLVMICVGVFVAGATIIPMSIDDSIASIEGSSKACMSVPWCFSLGFTFVFVALYSKLKRINRVLAGAKRFQKLTVSVMDVCKPLLLLLTLNVIFLTVWTIFDPMHYERFRLCGSGDLSSVGVCVVGDSSVSVAMLSSIVVINFLSILLANWEAWKARNVATEYSESKYIGILMLVFLELMLLGIPVIFLANENPTASYLLKAVIVFVFCVSILSLIFIPKMVSKDSGSSSRSQLGSQHSRSVAEEGLRIEDNTCHSHPRLSKSRIKKLEKLLLEKKGCKVELEPYFKDVGLLDASRSSRFSLASLRQRSFGSKSSSGSRSERRSSERHNSSILRLDSKSSLASDIASGRRPSIEKRVSWGSLEVEDSDDEKERNDRSSSPKEDEAQA